jgi:hypothetical protein
MWKCLGKKILLMFPTSSLLNRTGEKRTLNSAHTYGSVWKKKFLQLLMFPMRLAQPCVANRDKLLKRGERTLNRCAHLWKCVWKKNCSRYLSFPV